MAAMPCGRGEIVLERAGRDQPVAAAQRLVVQRTDGRQLAIGKRPDLVPGWVQRREHRCRPRARVAPG